MSYRFSDDDVPHFIVDISAGALCVACCDPLETEMDSATGLCRDCWRIVILGPAMEGRNK